MPPLSLVLPNQNGRTIAEKQFKTIEQPTADHPREDGVSEKELWPTLGIIDTNTESMSPDLPTFGNASKARIYRIGFGVAACIAVTCAFIAGIAVSRYSPPPGSWRGWLDGRRRRPFRADRATGTGAREGRSAAAGR